MKYILLLILAVTTSIVITFAQAPSTIIGIDSFVAKIKRQPSPKIIDVRSPEEYAINHVTNAVNVDLATPGYQQQFNAIAKTEPVFIYAINNGRTTKLANELLASGYTQVYELQGGIANWIGSGYAYYSSVKNNISLAEFKKLLVDKTPVLVDFYSRYCGLCKKARPVIDSFQQAYTGKLKVVYIDINDNPDLLAQLTIIHAVPTFVLYNQQNIVWQKTGIDQLEQLLQTALIKAQVAKLNTAQ